MFSPDGTLISATAAPHCGVEKEDFLKKFTRFVSVCPIKKRLFDLLFVLDLVLAS